MSTQPHAFSYWIKNNVSVGGSEQRSCARHVLVYGKMVDTFQNEAEQVIRILFDEYKLEEFTFHQFLKIYIMGYSCSYLYGLRKYHVVQQLHAMMGKWLLNHADDLKIHFVEFRESETIFGKTDKIAVWEKKE